MLPPEEAYRYYMANKQRRLREMVFKKLYSKTRVYAGYIFTDEIIKNTVRSCKISLTRALQREDKLIKEGILPIYHTTKPMKISQKVMNASGKTKLVLELTKIQGAERNPNHVYVNSLTREDVKVF